MGESIKQKNPTLHRYLFTVTTFSKLLAMVLFILLPFVGFYLGMRYQQLTTINSPINLQFKSDRVIESTSTPPILKLSDNSETENNVANWQEYVNTSVGFSFKYPETVSKLSYVDNSNNPPLLKPQEKSMNAWSNGFQFNFFPFKGSLVDLINLRKTGKTNNIIYGDSPIREIGDLDFNGIKGKWYAIGNPGFISPYTEVYFVGKDYGFIFTFKGENPSNQKTLLNNYSISNLLSTFKFTQ